MNFFGLASLIAALALVVCFLGNGVDRVQKDNAPKEDVLGNTLDAARDAANTLGN